MSANQRQPGYYTFHGPVTVTYPVYTKSYVECHNWRVFPTSPLSHPPSFGPLLTSAAAPTPPSPPRSRPTSPSPLPVPARRPPSRAPPSPPPWPSPPSCKSPRAERLRPAATRRRGPDARRRDLTRSSESAKGRRGARGHRSRHTICIRTMEFMTATRMQGEYKPSASCTFVCGGDFSWISFSQTMCAVIPEDVGPARGRAVFLAARTESLESRLD